MFIAMGDAIVGVLLGLGAVSLSGCCLLPVLQALIGRSSRKLAALLAVTAVIMSLAVSLSEVAFPYSRDMPKRLMLGHVHYTAAAVDAQQGSVAPVPMTIVNSSWVVAGSDSNSAGMLAEAMGFNLSTAQVATGNEWGMIYPVSKLLDLVLFPAKPSVGVVEHLPHVQLVNQRTLNQQEQSAVAGAVSSIPGEVIELDLEVFTEKPCWGTLRLFGADMVSKRTDGDMCLLRRQSIELMLSSQSVCISVSLRKPGAARCYFDDVTRHIGKSIRVTDSCVHTIWATKQAC